VPCCFAVFAQPRFLVFEGFSLPAGQFRVAADNAWVPAATVVAPVDALKSSTDLLLRNRLFSVLTSGHVDLSELSRLAGPVPRFKLGSGGDGIGTSGHVEVGDGGRTGVNGGF
jgi:hypothetical protein